MLFLGNEIYQGSGVTIKAAKQQAAVQVILGHIYVNLHKTYIFYIILIKTRLHSETFFVA